MVKTYSKKRDGDTRLSDNFRVREFACKDGSDTILIDDKLVKYLRRIRNWAGAPVEINSGYRTPSHNKKIGGSSTSKHCLGKAADIFVKDHKRSICEIARYADAIGVPGIELNEDKNYVHIDTRSGHWHVVMRNGKYHDKNFGGHCPYAEPKKSVKFGSTGDGVCWVQFWLRLWGYDVAVDGKFGNLTLDAVYAIQNRRGLKIDGSAGPQTRAALKGY